MLSSDLVIGGDGVLAIVHIFHALFKTAIKQIYSVIEARMLVDQRRSDLGCRLLLLSIQIIVFMLSGGALAIGRVRIVFESGEELLRTSLVLDELLDLGLQGFLLPVLDLLSELVFFENLADCPEAVCSRVFTGTAVCITVAVHCGGNTHRPYLLIPSRTSRSP